MESASECGAPPNPIDCFSTRPDLFSDTDASPVSSNYSSCDGSEFDRYCSANSVFGSASLCSSVGNCSGVGDDSPRECHSLREKSLRSRWNVSNCLPDGVSNDSSESPLDRTSATSAPFQCSKGSSSSCFGLRNDDNSGSSLFQRFVKGQESSSSPAGSSQRASFNEYSEAVEEGGSLTQSIGHLCNVVCLDFDTQRGIGLEADDDVLSHSEHSGVDSILDYGTDNEDQMQFYKQKSFNLVNNPKIDNSNPLLITSCVAFGSNDWDEFVQETGGGDLGLVSLHLDHTVQKQEGPIGTALGKEAEDVEVADSKAEDRLVKDAEDSLLIAANHKEQTTDIPGLALGDDECILGTRREADAVDLCTVDLGYDDSSGLQNSFSDGKTVKWNLSSLCNGDEILIQSSSAEQDTGKIVDEAFEGNVKGGSEDPPSYPLLKGDTSLQSFCCLNGEQSSRGIARIQFDKSSSFRTVSDAECSGIQGIEEMNKDAMGVVEVDFVEHESKELETCDSYDEMVLEMEEILLDSAKCHGSKYTQANHSHINQHLHHCRDGSSTASTSGTDDIYQPVHVPSKIDRVEIVGAKQKKGDVSFGERLVGVREYTIYRIKVNSDKDEWEVERRYRDFFALYCQLKALFTRHGLSLPAAWSSVEQESRKVFGNASPNVVIERSVLIEDCLCSILHSKYSFGIPRPLVCFLTPGKAIFKSSLLQAFVPRSLQKFVQDENLNCGREFQDDSSSLGKTISLIVEVKPHKSLRQLLEIQQYKCAGCRRHLDAGKTFLRELVQTFGWNRPRFCEYTGQLFCASCHSNDVAVLPARVLHYWDFSLYPVSQLAKAFLESIYDKPMLCVSAVNPFLFSKIPALLHVMGFRKKIGAMLPYVICPFRNSIQKSLGIRRHLLESNDFFALRDLVDLSKGPFSALPVMVENISNLILEHITQQCLICYDAGVACAARQACHDPSSMIFPFQETEAEKCSSCGSIYHKACFVNLLGCPCSEKPADAARRVGPTGSSTVGPHVEPSIQPLVSTSTAGFFSNILSKARPDKLWKPKNSSPVILMGSLTNSSL
ncbi:hypothetical protein AXF42_Ash008537 [Apostasia shenzhenica]|uniref:PX domain-containing protein n=1 Tax=Apostasia shenzhenica TaxID=1088818 RepID=A0A2I0B1N2_9ASPA|nr:hypothetical protein AXF42_Ash008537 [Apostasia shenzhenica]